MEPLFAQRLCQQLHVAAVFHFQIFIYPVKVRAQANTRYASDIGNMTDMVCDFGCSAVKTPQ